MFIMIGIALTVIGLVITLLIALGYLGLFESVQVSTGAPPLPFGGRKLAYKCHRDTYAGVGFQFTKQYNFTAVQEPTVRNLFSKCEATSMYYDSPSDYQGNCRFLVGLLLTEEAAASKEAMDALEADGYRFATLPNVDHVVHACFPLRSNLGITIALRKAYPAIDEYVRGRRLCAYPSMEFYTSSQIYFILPLAQQQDFFYYYEDENNTTYDDQPVEDVDVEELLNAQDDEEAEQQSECEKKVLRRSSSSASSFDELNMEENA